MDRPDQSPSGSEGICRVPLSGGRAAKRGLLECVPRPPDSAFAWNPVSRLRPPAYPTKLQILASPGLLEKRLPPAWAINRELAAAVGVFLAAGASGCRTEPSAANEGRANLSADVVAIVAPIFEHGEGRVSMGCIAVSPPALLSEDEALEIIKQEFANAGIHLSRRDVVAPDVIIVGKIFRSGYDWIAAKKTCGWQDVPGPLVVDLQDIEHAINIEFVSRDDFELLGGSMDVRAAVLDIKSVADSVAAEVNRQGQSIYFGAFYEPVVYADWRAVRNDASGELANSVSALEEYKIMNRHAKQQCERRTQEDLRLQVRDFVDWLKAQGVI